MIFSIQSLEELKQYIQYEYEATDAETVCIMSPKNSFRVIATTFPYTQGTKTREAYIRLFDQTNNHELCATLNGADVDESIYLGDEPLCAETIE